MKVKILLYLFLGIFGYQSLAAQTAADTIVLKCDIRFGEKPLALHQHYVSRNDTLQFTMLKFYLSALEFTFADGTIFKEKDSYHLIDIENSPSLQIVVPSTDNSPISTIRFAVGVDGGANESGANGGDLDLQNGMYWAWQSGYINFKMEGKSNSCKTRNSEFQFHIGGYQQPFNAFRTIELPAVTSKDPSKIDLIINLAKLFDNIALAKINSVMVPGKNAMAIADMFKEVFSIE
ncbi:MbnP family protein [Flavobacterium sp.]|uniref:MbnP family protein n=1 Tax=Flavobacterium sp. TaxID=239 RepID=UPI00261D6082|nr:MbnP family protein [Flavobacterium sp.]